MFLGIFEGGMLFVQLLWLCLFPTRTNAFDCLGPTSDSRPGRGGGGGGEGGCRSFKTNAKAAKDIEANGGRTTRANSKDTH